MDGFNSSFDKARSRAGLNHLNFHDLRGTTVTRLARNGATVPQIVSITGHSLKSAQNILEKHYLGGQSHLAEAAIPLLESNEISTNTVNGAVNNTKIIS